MIYLKKLDEVFYNVSASYEILHSIKKLFTAYAQNYKYSPKYKIGIWDGKISLFDSEIRKLPIGLKDPYLDEFCKKNNIQCVVEQENNILIEKDFEIFVDKIYKDSNSDFILRDYQKNALYESLKNKRCVLNLCTGSGKSLTIYYILRYMMEINKKCLLIVPNINLVNQMYSDFEEYGWKNIDQNVCKLYNGLVIKDSCNILISTWQSLNTLPNSFFTKYESVLVDECHICKSLVLKQILEKCVNCDYRIGTTGTIPEDKLDYLTIFGYLGKEVYETRSKELIEKNILSNMKIINVLLQYPLEFIKKNCKRSYLDETKTLNTYEPRNTVFKYIYSKIKDGQNSLILCQKHEHLENIKQYLEKYLDTKYKIYIIHGKINPTVRENIRKSLENEGNAILLGTYATLSTGFNVKNIHHVIFASSYKSRIKVLQSIGRLLRKHESKNCAIIWDLVDDLTIINRNGNINMNHVYKHWQTRLSYYNEQKFEYVTTKFELYKY